MPWIGPLKLKAQLFCEHETAMGPGKADLLEAIDREGSISAAGRVMGMSYRRTWLLVGTLYYRTGAYAVANLRVDYDLTDKLTVGVGGSNLFDASYRLVDGFPEPGRSFFISARARY
jgi:outer membrane receptor protein involved in Fe transport